MSVNLSDYFKTYFGENLRDHFVNATPGGDDIIAPSSRLLQKRREAMEVHNAMRIQREEFDSTLRSLHIRKDELHDKEVKMKEYLHRFDNFLMDNETKRSRAIRKAGQERELTNRRCEDLCILQKEMKDLLQKRESLEGRIKKNDIFPSYLDKVVQASEQFQEARQVMSRYDTLMLTRQDLVRTTQQNQDNTENARAELNRFIEQTNDTLLHYNNKLAQLQSQLDHAQEEGMIWESRWTHIQNTAAKKTLLLGTIKMATLNLYQSVCKHSRDTSEQPVTPEDTPRQLDKIQTFLTELISIWEDVTKQDAAVTVYR